MSEINLAFKKSQEGLESKKILKTLRIISSLSLILTLFFSVGIFLIKISSPLPALKEEEKRLLVNLSSSKQNIAKSAILIDRLRTISDILSKRLDFDSIAIYLLKDAPSNIKVKSLTVDKKTVLITISSSSLRSLDILIDSLDTMVSSKKILRQIRTTEITADGVLGEYSLSINADLL